MWCNYHSCSISSTKWAGNGTGFLAGTKIAPLDFAKLGKKTFSFDDNPEDLSPPRPFGIYLTGHDSVCGHHIRFKPEKSKTTFAIEWNGKVALSYGGSDEFKYSFKASLSNVRFDGIQLPHGTSSFDALALAETVPARCPFRMEDFQNKRHAATLAEITIKQNVGPKPPSVRSKF